MLVLVMRSLLLSKVAIWMNSVGDSGSPPLMIFLLPDLGHKKKLWILQHPTTTDISWKWKPGALQKHCQRHNGPRGWVHLAKVFSWSHITNSNTNLGHISSSESRLSIKNLNQTSASPLNLKFKILTKPSFRISTLFNFITSTNHQRQNAAQTPASKSCLNFNFKILKAWTKV